MATDTITHNMIYPEDVNKAFNAFSKLLSSRKARECLQSAETALAFDTEIFLQPIRQDLAECLDLIADMIRERGTDGANLQHMIPILSDWLDPGKKFAQEVAKLEKIIAEKKRKHPDFIYAIKLQVLIGKYEEQIKGDSIDSFEYDRIVAMLDGAKRTLADHMQNKIRIAQRAFAPDMLELAQSQLHLGRLQEKILRIKQELLSAAQGHTQHTLENLAKIFQGAEPELADTILAQTRALMSTGTMPSPDRPSIPSNLSEFKEELTRQSEKIKQFDERLKSCLEQLRQILEFEDAIFNTYGEQLRARGIQFKKTAKVEKTVTSAGIPRKFTGHRMVSRLGDK